METITAIALLCGSPTGHNDYLSNSNYRPAEALKCQQYYVNCVNKKTYSKGDLNPLAQCVLERKLD